MKGNYLCLSLPNASEDSPLEVGTCDYGFFSGFPLTPTKNDSRLAKLYVSDIKLYEALGTQLDFSTVYHYQTDRQSERVIQILKDMLRNCVIDFWGSWEDYLLLTEFAYNNSF
ncbi:Gag protease polyprotein [Gossypium australe]|uniref:Gag protease polyprotein n=1 Tax=Gossypium australe TaxID=47621 RepID=A0A5B6VM04_9ROSI|nr:Gag protease polyprotein [Gossypium australe]